MERSDADMAINRVLQAEVEAREAIESCRREAAARIIQAGSMARRISTRVDRRVARISALADRAIAAQCGELEQQARALQADGGLADDERARLDRAVTRLIDDWLDAGDGP